MAPALQSRRLECASASTELPIAAHGVCHITVLLGAHEHAQIATEHHTCWLKMACLALRRSSSATEALRLASWREGKCEGVDSAFISSAFLSAHTVFSTTGICIQNPEVFSC